MARPALSDGAGKALALFHEGKTYHDLFVKRVNDSYKAFSGDLDSNSEAADWESQLHPPFIKHIVETTCAGLVDDRFSYKVVPAPRFYDPGEYDQAKEGAKAHELLHRCQLRHDRFNELMLPFVLQNAITGLTVAKTTQQKIMRRTPELEEKGMDEDGLPILGPSEPVEQVVYQGPHTELVDVRDFFWHPAAPEIQQSLYVAHRAWYPVEKIKQMGKAGLFTNTEWVETPKGQGDDGPPRDNERDRTKDMVAVLEIWYLTETGIRTVTLANEAVELVVDRQNPYWHGQYPFVTCSTQPELFRIDGMSVVEKIRHLQTASWDIFNQTIDGLRLANNFITVLRSDIEDPDNYVFEPRARWIVDDPSQVQQLKIDPASTQVALPHLERLEQQMQNLAGSQPFTSTSEGQVNATTATQAALVTDLASRSLQVQKGQIYRAFERICQQRQELNRQYIRTPQIVSELGVDNEQEMSTVSPYLLKGDYIFEGTPMTESLMRAERRAEAQSVFQLTQAYAPVAAQLSQAGVAKMVNMDRAYTDLLEAFDIQNPEAYFVEAKGPPMQPQQPQGQEMAPDGPGGVTAPQSIAPEVSPSNQSSISPQVFMQRALAGLGGAVNGPTPGPAG